MATQKRVLELMHKHGGYWVLFATATENTSYLMYIYKRSTGIDASIRTSKDVLYQVAFYTDIIFIMLMMPMTLIWMAFTVTSLMLYGRQFQLSKSTILIFLASLGLFCVTAKYIFVDRRYYDMW